MKTTNIYSKYLNDFWSFISKVPKAIVSGMPSQKVYSKPNKESKVYLGDEEIKQDYEKHYHRPDSKTVVEKQTILKETKKSRGTHKQ